MKWLTASALMAALWVQAQTPEQQATTQAISPPEVKSLDEPAAPNSLPTQSATLPVFSAQEIAQAVDKEYAVIYKMPQWVDKVVPMCQWKSSSNNSFQGYVRITLAHFAGRNQLYLQWMQRGLDGAQDRTLSTRVVEELDAKRLTFVMPSAQIFQDHCLLKMQGQSADNQFYQVQLMLKEPGSYQFEISKTLGEAER